MADTKITALPANTDPQAGDLLTMVDDPSGGADNQKITIENLLLATDGIIPAARVYNNANLSIPDSAGTALTFNSEVFDTDGIHDTGSNPSRLTCQTAGKYLVAGSVKFSTNATGYRAVNIKLNGGNNIATFNNLSTGGGVFLTISSIINLSVSHYVELYVFQNSTGSLNVEYGADFSPFFMMIRIGD